jgi:hypothetical protein
MLYLGEGIKKHNDTGLGNSDPTILIFFIKILKEIYLVPNEKIRCELYLRHDQNIEDCKKFWSTKLKLPLNCFRYSHIDQRTTGKTTTDYHGVCLVRCGKVEIQRDLVYLGREFLRVIEGL